MKLIIIINIMDSQQDFDIYITDIINSVFEQRTRKHIIYYNLLQRLWSSTKLNKVKLSKYLLSRLIRESSNIIFNAQNHFAQNAKVCKESKKTDIYSFTVH